jgi:hypothetical protein
MRTVVVGLFITMGCIPPVIADSLYGYGYVVFGNGGQGQFGDTTGKKFPGQTSLAYDQEGSIGTLNVVGQIVYLAASSEIYANKGILHSRAFASSLTNGDNAALPVCCEGSTVNTLLSWSDTFTVKPTLGMWSDQVLYPVDVSYSVRDKINVSGASISDNGLPTARGFWHLEVTLADVSRQLTGTGEPPPPGSKFFGQALNDLERSGSSPQTVSNKGLFMLILEIRSSILLAFNYTPELQQWITSNKFRLTNGIQRKDS